MVKNFLVSWESLTEGRYWTLLTSVFSHNLVWHLFMNMFVLRSFGSLMEEILGPKKFLAFYLLAGAFSSLSHSLVSAFLLGLPEQPALGASGAISAVVILFALLYPKQKLFLFAIIPVPALWGALAFVGLDIWGLMAQAEGKGLPIGHGAHLGGAFIGVLYFLYLKKQRLQPQY